MTSLRLREQDLEGKVAVITGAARGIGRVISLNLASRGCSVLGTCSSNENIDLITSMGLDIEEVHKKANHAQAPKILGIGANIPKDRRQTRGFSFMAGTTANSVSVGLTQTDSVMMCPPDALEKFKHEFLPLQSIPRFGQPDDVADVVGMLCSRDPRWIIGCVIDASGGGIKIG